MATGLSTATIDAMLEWAFHFGSASQPVDTYYIQWHDGDPGAAGTANIATNLSSRDVLAGSTPFWEAGLDGQAKNKTAGESSQAAGAATITHFSIWTLATNGVFKGSGTTNSVTLATNEKLTYGAGDLTIDITEAS